MVHVICLNVIGTLVTTIVANQRTLPESIVNRIEWRLYINFRRLASFLQLAELQ